MTEVVETYKFRRRDALPWRVIPKIAEPCRGAWPVPQNTGIALTLVESQGDRESVEPIELVVTTQDDDPIRYEFGIDVDCFRNGIGTIVRVLQQTAAL